MTEYVSDNENGEDGYAQLITSGTHGDYGVFWYDMSVLSGGSISAFCLIAVPASSGMPAIIYSTASFDMDGVVATEGWNIDQLDWQDTVAEVSQQDIWGKYISKAPFTSGSGDAFAASELYITKGSLAITENGSYDVADKATVEVNIASDGTPATASTEDELNALDTTENVGKVIAYNGALYIITED